MKEEVEKALEKIAPFIALEGGTFQLVKVEDGIVYVKVGGNCENCIYGDNTLVQELEDYLIYEIPEVKGVISTN